MKKIISLSLLMNMSVCYAAGNLEGMSFSSLIGLVILIILILVVIFGVVVKIAGNSVKSHEAIDSDFGGDIKGVITDFEEEDFLSWVTERFVKFQKSWSRGAIEELHPFETERLFEMHRMQLTELKQKNMSNIVEGISVKETEIVSFSNKKDLYEVVVHVRATMRNYMVDHNISNEVDAMTASESFNYYLTFEKQKQNKKLKTCPACTAPVSVNVVCCEYCHTNFPEAMDQWLLSKIEVQ